MRVIVLDEISLRTRIADRLLATRMAPTVKEAHARADAILEGLASGQTELEIEGAEYRLEGASPMKPRLVPRALVATPQER